MTSDQNLTNAREGEYILSAADVLAKGGAAQVIAFRKSLRDGSVSVGGSAEAPLPKPGLRSRLKAWLIWKFVAVKPCRGHDHEW